MFLRKLFCINPTTPGSMSSKSLYYILSYVQTHRTTPNIVVPTTLGVVGCILAVVWKWMQQLPTMLEELCKRIHHCCAMLRQSQNKRNVGSCWLKSLTGLKLCATAFNRVCKWMQHVTPKNVGRFLLTMLCSFARSPTCMTCT